MTDANQQTETENNFHIHKLFVKDASFEIPAGSQTFQKEWKPELGVEIDHQHKSLQEENVYEVILRVKCTVKNADEVAFIAEVLQAGIFAIKSIEGDQLQHVLGAFCPNLLYPYLREAISDLVAKGGFPQLALAPINFDMLYEQQKQQANGQTKEETQH